MIKLSVLFFYRRLFLGKIFNVMSWILIAFTICWMAAFFIGLFFDCGSHISANWGSLTEISEQCKFGFLPTIVYTVIDAVLDLTILIFPLPWVSHTLTSTCSTTDFRTGVCHANVPSQEALCDRLSYAWRLVSLTFNHRSSETKTFHSATAAAFIRMTIFIQSGLPSGTLLLLAPSELAMF